MARQPKTALAQIVESVEPEGTAPRSTRHRSLGAFGLQVFDPDSGTLAPGYEEFARYVARGHSTRDAWERAFREPYQYNIADDLLLDPVMRLRIGTLHAQKLAVDAEIRRNVVRASGMDATYVAERLDMVFRMSMGQDVVIPGGEDEEPRLLRGRFEPKAAIAALELVGRWQGMWRDQAPKVQTELADMTADEIAAEKEQIAERRRLLREAMPQITQALTITVNNYGHRTEDNDLPRERATILHQEPLHALEAPLTPGGGREGPRRAEPRPGTGGGAPREAAAPGGFVSRLRP